jgi:hypothetical protein
MSIHLKSFKNTEQILQHADDTPKILTVHARAHFCITIYWYWFCAFFQPHICSLATAQLCITAHVRTWVCGWHKYDAMVACLSVKLWEKAYDVVSVNFLSGVSRVGQYMRYRSQSRMCTCLQQHEVFRHNYGILKLLASLIHRESDNRFNCVTLLSQGETLVQSSAYRQRYNPGSLHRAVFIHHITV